MSVTSTICAIEPAVARGRVGSEVMSVAGCRATSVEERLRQRIVDGDRPGLEQDLADALTRHAPLAIGAAVTDQGQSLNRNAPLHQLGSYEGTTKVFPVAVAE